MRRALLAPLATVALAGAAVGMAPPAAAVPSCFGRPATIVGTAGADHIAGTSGPDVIAGLGGGDVIGGFRAADRICGGPGADDIDGGGGNDRIAGGAGNDVLSGDTGDDIIRGNRGQDYASFSGGNGVTANLLSGHAVGQGSDTLQTIENLLGSSQPDQLTGDDAQNVFFAGGGGDLLQGRDAHDELVGQDGPDHIGGNGGPDFLFGNADDDELIGGAGQDEAFGGPHVNGDVCDAEGETGCEF